MNRRRSCITDTFGPQKWIRSIYSIIVQYEQSTVKYAEKWKKIWLKTAYIFIFEILEYNKILMPAYNIQSVTVVTWFIYFCKLCLFLRFINENCNYDAWDSLSLMQVTAESRISHPR